MAEQNELSPQSEWETSRYAEDIRRVLRGRKGNQWVSFENPETANNPEFINGINAALRDFGHVPVWMENKTLPQEPQELHLEDIHRALIERILASLPEEERAGAQKFIDAHKKEDVRDVLGDLSVRLWADEKYLTIFYKPLEDILERIPEGEERDRAVLNLFKAVRSVIKGGHYTAMVIDKKKMDELALNRMAFNEAAYTHIRS